MTTNNSVNTYIVPTTANEVTMPSQPAFLAFNSVQDNDVTGNGAQYTVVFDTEIFDQNSDYNTGTGTFTAPVTGRYQINWNVGISDLTAAMTSVLMRVPTSNRNYDGPQWNIGTARTASNSGDLNMSFLCDMDAADTATFTIGVYNGGGNTADVQGTDTDPVTWVSGYLAV
jgi:hypothetical protein